MLRLNKVKDKLKQINYRHYIAVAITLFFFSLTIFIFPNSLTRFVESCKDFGTSIAYYVKEIFELEYNVYPTVNTKSIVPWTAPFGLPETWEEFVVLWDNYWKILFTKDNFMLYLGQVADGFYYASKYILILGMPIIFIFVLLFRRYMTKQNNDYNKDSKALIWHKKINAKVYEPIKLWIRSFIDFVKENKRYYQLWIAIWCWNFNIISIVIEFLAYYFYFVVSFKTNTVYLQLYKLLVDLSVMIAFIPPFCWVIIFYFLICVIRKKIGYARLNHYEHKNCGFINERPIVLMVCGTMGKKKTTIITDMALSQEVMLRDKAFEKILQNDLKFPYFPWINLENTLKYAMSKHIVYNLATTKKFIQELYYWFKESVVNPSYRKSIRKYLKRKYNIRFYNLCFDYDYDRYGLFYDDKLKVSYLWEIIETYSQLYFIYIIECSLIISNYSVRTDNLLEDLGNFPMWNTDFFEKDSRLIDSFSRHSHIIDFDSLRLGKKIIENNPKKDCFEFGVINLTEVGKERKNNLELKETKKKDTDKDGKLLANQKNDGFNDWLKMIRHSATVDMFPFVKVITDEQRPESWGADARDLLEVVHIKSTSDFELAMPFFTITELLYMFVFSKFEKLYMKYRFVRSDNTLPMYLLKSLTAKFNHYYNGIHNTFGVCTATVQVESGTLDGQIEDKKYYLMSKKIYSKRFSTDCFSDFFNKKALKSSIGIADLEEYVTEKASFEELEKQNSYFINDLMNRKDTDTE